MSQNGKGSKSRIKDYNKYWSEYDEINWSAKKEVDKKDIKRYRLDNKLCLLCGGKIGNDVFTVCDKCWDR